MIWNKEKKYIFIEVPKTGTSSIARHLLDMDRDCLRDVISTNSGEKHNVPTHASAKEIRNILGKEISEYTVVAFIRDPAETIISKYYFYKFGRAAKRSRQENGNLGRKLRVASAQLLPLSIWSLLYPFKSSSHFIMDRGEILVDVLADFSEFEEQFRSIFSTFGYSDPMLSLPMENKTEYAAPKPLERAAVRCIASIKCSTDQRLYKAVRANLASIRDK